MEHFFKVLKHLSMDEPLPQKYYDHALINDWNSYRECHIKPDWLLIYKKYDDILLLARMGSHSALF